MASPAPQAFLSLFLAAGAGASGGRAPSHVLTLERAEAMALERNGPLRRTELQIRSAEADRIQARAAILPRLDFNASLGRSRNGGGEVTGSFVDPSTGETVPLTTPTQVFSTYSGGLWLQQILFDGGKWWSNLEAKESSLSAAKQDAAEARQDTIYGVRQRFYALILAERQLQVFSQAAARSRAQAEATQRLFESGRQTQSEVFAARANRDNDEINQLGQEARVEMARQDLAVAVGVEPGESIAVEEPPRLFDDLEPSPPVEAAVAGALSKRAKLRALAHRLESQRQAVAAASGDYWPTIGIGVGYSRQARSPEVFTSSLDKVSTATVGLTFNWNLFNGLATRAQVEKARVQVLQAENDLSDARRSVAAEVERCVARLAAARRVALVAQRSEEASSEGLELARARQEQGSGSQMEVRDAELKLTQVQLARVSALLDGRDAEAALHRAMGVL